MLTNRTSARPVVRGQQMAEPRLFPFPLNPPRTHSQLYHHMCLRTYGHERKDSDTALRTIFVPFEAKGVLYAWGPVQPANGPLKRTTSG